MTPHPDAWVEEDRHVIAERLTDAMMRDMTVEDLRRVVWDTFYDDLVHQDWEELFAFAEDFDTELLKEFTEDPNQESSY
jgi:hypothetical protein